MGRPSRFWRVMRIVYVSLLGIFLVGLFVQAYLAGRGIFGADDFRAHASVGWPLAHGFALLVLIASFLTRGPKRLWITSIAWGLAVMALPVLAVLDDAGSHPAEALHPLVAMVVLALSLYLWATTWNLIRDSRDATSPAADQGADPAVPGQADPLEARGTSTPPPDPTARPRGIETPPLPLPPRVRRS